MRSVLVVMQGVGKRWRWHRATQPSPTEMTDRDRKLTPFAGLIGIWTTEATHPQFDGTVRGSTTFEWLDGGHFIIERSQNDHELFPDAISVIGAPEAGEGLVMEYFDSRGVRLDLWPERTCRFRPSR